MPTLHEILANAPIARSGDVTLEKLRANWDALKAHAIKTGSGGRIVIDSHVMACLLSGSDARVYLLSQADISAFDAIVQRARTKLNDMNLVNPKIKAIYDGCRTAAGDY